MAQLKTKRSCKLLCQTNSPSCKLSRSNLFQPLLSIILVSSIASSAVAETETGVLTITDANWTVTMDGEWMIKFVAPWCPACAQLKEQWERFSSLAAAMGVSVGEVDVTEQPGLSGRFLVTTLPTIFQMSCMAGLFRLSLWIRWTHGYLTGDLGMPVWGSYLSFAMATLVTGLLMGLVLVLVADCLCPSRQKRKEERAGVCVSMAEKRQASEADEGEGSNKEDPETLRQRRGQAKRTS
ncbi:thioredoxin-related transmembrane protein 4 isoform X2 [Oncorhynchus keta]|uniref:thioredoxin-related transmembrane protein 4 isoform X2 n=1 Tax=Oncorhynchus keta TaxID=8018 RepID=UPI0015FB0E46|nr:thioredoxin-related transmembrane protein 4 isoform X2 [Oncorhynchus keta]